MFLKQLPCFYVLDKATQEKKNDQYILCQWYINQKGQIGRKFLLVNRSEAHRLLINNNHIFDMFLSGQTHLFIDIDIKDNDLSLNKDLMNEMLQQIYISLQFTERQKEYFIFSSSTKEKESYHIHFYNTYFENSMICEGSIQIKKVIQSLKEKYQDNKYIQSIDTNVYKRNVCQLRAIGQTKPGKENYKRPMNLQVSKYDMTLQKETTEVMQLCFLQNIREDQEKIQCLYERGCQSGNENVPQETVEELMKRIKDMKDKERPRDKYLELHEIEILNEIRNTGILLQLQKNYNFKYLEGDRILLTPKSICVCPACGCKQTFHGTYLSYCIERGILIMVCGKYKQKHVIYKLSKFEQESKGVKKYCQQQGIKYFSINREKLQQGDINFLQKQISFIKSDTGTGKTELFFELESEKRYLLITHRISQKSSTIHRLRENNGDFRFLDYQEEEDQKELYGPRFLENKGIFSVVQYNSLKRLVNLDYDYLILDESVSLEIDILQDMNFYSFMRNFQGVQDIKFIFMDALMDQNNMEFWKLMLKAKTYNMQMLENTYVKTQSHMILNSDVKRKKLDILSDLFENLKNRGKFQNISISFDRKDALKKVVELLIKRFRVSPQEILQFHGDQNQNTKIYNTENIQEVQKNRNIKFILYSQTITCGFSFVNEDYKQHISYYSSKDLIMPHDQYQQFYRSRCADTFYHICPGSFFEKKKIRNFMRVQDFPQHLQYQMIYNTFYQQKTLSQGRKYNSFLDYLKEKEIPYFDNFQLDAYQHEKIEKEEVKQQDEYLIEQQGSEIQQIEYIQENDQKKFQDICENFRAFYDRDYEDLLELQNFQKQKTGTFEYYTLLFFKKKGYQDYVKKFLQNNDIHTQVNDSTIKNIDTQKYVYLKALHVFNELTYFEKKERVNGGNNSYKVVGTYFLLDELSQKIGVKSNQKSYLRDQIIRLLPKGYVKGEYGHKKIFIKYIE